jgi:hypothetical protein
VEEKDEEIRRIETESKSGKKNKNMKEKKMRRERKQRKGEIMRGGTEDGRGKTKNI